MKLRAKICLYIFLVFSFVALGILSYYVFNSDNDSVMVGSRKFVTFNSVNGAYSYDIQVSNDEQTQGANYKITKDTNGTEINFKVEVKINDQLLAEESYLMTILNEYDNNKIDCSVTNYTINFFNNGEVSKTITYPQEILNNVDKDIFCCIVVEYFDEIFNQDGQYSVSCIPKDIQGEYIYENDEAVIFETNYDYVAIYENDFANREKFYYYGEWYDYIIESKEELYSLVGWAILYRQNDINFFIKTNQINSSNFKYLITDAINEYPEYDALENNYNQKIIGQIGYIQNLNYYLDDNFLLTYKDLQNLNPSAYSFAIKSLRQPDENFFVDYVLSTPTERNFYINSSEVVDEVLVFNSEQLYMVVQSGARPIFIDGKSDVAKTIYYNAIEVLVDINNSDYLTDYEKALNIYRYITQNVMYDYVIYDFMSYENDFSIKSFGNYSCFYLESIFYDFEDLEYKYAVCDGLAKAYSLLCNIEGIECFKVNGTVGDGNHAWNKIYLDEQDCWYYVDTTWGQAVYYDNDSSSYKQILTHSYFLFKQDDYERYIIYPKNTEIEFPSRDFNYYEHTTVEYNNLNIDFFVENDEDLKNILSWANKQIMLGKSSLLTEIKFSYDYILNPNSSINKLLNTTNGSKTWFLQNGVFCDCEYIFLDSQAKGIRDLVLFRFY